MEADLAHFIVAGKVFARPFTSPMSALSVQDLALTWATLTLCPAETSELIQPYLQMLMLYYFVGVVQLKAKKLKAQVSVHLQSQILSITMKLV